jgi:beta-lactam-binding protein with PASTA domain
MRRGSDRAIGIVLGLLLGIAIVAVFVFVFSGDTVDAPSIDEGAPTEQSAEP